MANMREQSWRVENATRGTLVGDQVRVARSLWERTLGLLATRSLEPGQGLWIEHAPSIHMFFMRYPIDAVFVSRDATVVRVVEGLKPWRAVLWARGARDCLELPSGTIGTGQIRVGDRLSREPLAAS